MAYKYSFQNYNKESMARAFSTNSPISLKKSVEVARAIRGKKISSIVKFLEGVVAQEVVVPYKRFNTEMPHRRGKGVAAGGYPVNVAKEFLRLILAVKKNATEKELSESDLYLLSVSVRKGVQRYHNGRQMGRKMKSTNVEVIAGLKKK